MSAQQGNLPVRLVDVVNAGVQVIQFIRALDTDEALTAQQGHHALQVMDQMATELQTLLLRVTTDRNRLLLQIAETEQAEQEFTAQAARAARRGGESADDDARAALRKAHRLRADLDVWKADLPEANEVVRQAQALDSFLAESRAGLERLVQSLERSYQAAEAKTSMAGFADWIRQVEHGVRIVLAERVRETQAEADARYSAALNNDEIRILRLRSENLAYEVDDELERLRRDPR